VLQVFTKPFPSIPSPCMGPGPECVLFTPLILSPKPFSLNYVLRPCQPVPFGDHTMPYDRCTHSKGFHVPDCIVSLLNAAPRGPWSFDPKTSEFTSMSYVLTTLLSPQIDHDLTYRPLTALFLHVTQLPFPARRVILSRPFSCGASTRTS
jgi:hypothetical protein